MLIKIPGENMQEKADDLAIRLKQAFEDLNVRGSRSARMTELRIIGLNDFITPADVPLAIGKVGNTS